MSDGDTRVETVVRLWIPHGMQTYEHSLGRLETVERKPDVASPVTPHLSAVDLPQSRRLRPAATGRLETATGAITMMLHNSINALIICNMAPSRWDCISIKSPVRENVSR